MDELWVHLFATWEEFKPVFALIGAAGVTVTGLVAAAYAFFRFLGEKWLDLKFAKELEKFKAEQAQELAKLRYKIDGAFDRTKRLQDREYEALPKIWAKLIAAKSHADAYLSEFPIYSDVASLGESELGEFLDTKRFSEEQKHKLKQAENHYMASDRQSLCNEMSELVQYSDARANLADASRSLSAYGIFILPPLRDDMKKLIRLMLSAVDEYNVNKKNEDAPYRGDQYSKLKNCGELLFQKIEEAVAGRLWDTTVTED